MLYWLDNNENHKDAVNENWGRELLELFSMGVGNYTEVDVRECSRAFTGWTITPKLARFPMGRFDWFFEYRDEDHDDTEKTFLGRRATSAARTSSTSSAGSRPPPGSSPATSTTSSSPMNPRSRPGP